MSDLKQIESSGATKAESVPTQAEIAERVERLLSCERPRFQRLWVYCRNPMRPWAPDSEAGSERPYRQAQEWGMPSRITGFRSGFDPLTGQRIAEIARKEVVIENDIGWRIETMVDYLFGKPLVIESAAEDPERRGLIGELLRLILAQNGGILFLQQIALLGSVYGFVDVLVKFDAAQSPAEPPVACGTQELGHPPARDGMEESGSVPTEGPADREAQAVNSAGPAPVGGASGGDSRIDVGNTRAASHPSPKALLGRLARMVRLEIVEPARALPFLCPTDYRTVHAYGQCFEVLRESDLVREGAGSRRNWLERVRSFTSGRKLWKSSNERDVIVELITPTTWVRYRNEEVVAQGANSLGRIPLVHIQNTAVPFEYSGASDVEPLVPLQDELNTRLSDRAHRITMQSFKMYLGKGIENFTSLPVAPGRMWMSDNEQAEVIEFGGDSTCPSEEDHISDMREAMDKTSGVTPIAAGAIKGRIGHLTSAAALRITLQALLSKTEKKRTTYGTAVQQMCELALAWLDRAGLFKTTAQERRVELSWASPLPENELERLQEAETKLRIGVSKEVVLRELGY